MFTKFLGRIKNALRQDKPITASNSVDLPIDMYKLIFNQLSNNPKEFFQLRQLSRAFREVIDGMLKSDDALYQKIAYSKASKGTVFKFLLIGGPQSGKLEILNHGQPQNTNWIPTDFSMFRQTKFGTEINVQLWDVTNEANRRTITKLLFAGTNAILFVFDEANPQSYQFAKEVANNVFNASPDIKIKMVFVAVDRKEDASVDNKSAPLTEDKIKEDNSKFKSYFFRVTGSNKEEVTKFLGKLSDTVVKDNLLAFN